MWGARGKAVPNIRRPRLYISVSPWAFWVGSSSQNLSFTLGMIGRLFEGKADAST